MSRAEFEKALGEGRRAAVGDPNPYAGGRRALAGLWQRGYSTMLLERIYQGPAMQTYLAGREDS